MNRSVRSSILIAVALWVSAAAVAQGVKKAPLSPHEKKATAAGLTADAVKKFIARKEKNSATGVGSVHKTATVTFESVRFGAPRSVDRRDQLINGIKGSTVYPVRVKYVSHRTWGNGETEDKAIHYDYEFFKDSYGEWDAYLVGPVRP